jgi:hypothetical protein
MNLGSTSTTINASPIISLEHYITLSLPFIRFKILIPVIVSTTFSLLLEPLLAKYRRENRKNK